MTRLERALDLSYPAFAILHQQGRFSGPPHQRVCEAILGDLRIARRQGVRGVVLEIFSRDQQVMGFLLPDAGPPELLGFNDRTMIYEGDAKDWEAKVHWHGNPEAPAVKREDGRGLEVTPVGERLRFLRQPRKAHLSLPRTAAVRRGSGTGATAPVHANSVDPQARGKFTCPAEETMPNEPLPTCC